MKKNIHLIEIEGREYPVRMVMGALLMYKRQTGDDASAMDPDDVEALLTLFYCCVACACKAEGVEWPYTFEEFCNVITPQDVAAWNRSMQAEQAEAAAAEKKTGASLQA